MLIKLTLTNGKLDFYIRADIVLIVERHRENIGETIVTTTIMTPRGPISYNVLESPAAVAEAVSAALASGKPATASSIIH